MVLLPIMELKETSLVSKELLAQIPTVKGKLNCALFFTTVSEANTLTVKIAINKKHFLLIQVPPYRTRMTTKLIFLIQRKRAVYWLSKNQRLVSFFGVLPVVTVAGSYRQLLFYNNKFIISPLVHIA